MKDAPRDFWDDLRRATPAHIALGRIGDGLPTQRALEFQLAHARARDAVRAALDPAPLLDALAPWTPLLVESQAKTRKIFLQRPDLGRLLAAESAARLVQGDFDVTIVLADGLSAHAVETEAVPLCRILFGSRAFSFAPPVVALRARVALGDEIAERQGARLVIMLIGERPGLSACDSLGAYITFHPRPGATRDAERNCVSNIRQGGLAREEAARRILAIMALARAMKLTGTQLKEDAALSLAPPQEGRVSE